MFREVSPGPRRTTRLPLAATWATEATLLPSPPQPKCSLCSPISRGGYWTVLFGGISVSDYSEPSGGWRWVTGEPWSYTNWSANQPDNFGQTEESLQLFNHSGAWNDGTGADLVAGYVVEYESYPYLFHSDFNGDGKTDLVLQNQSGNQIAIWNLNGLTVNGGALVSAVPDASYHVVATADFNGDGHPDFALQNQTTGQVILWYMNGTTLMG